MTPDSTTGEPTDGQPTDMEAAAIAAAVDALWPRAEDPEAVRRRESVWKFSGRWWSQPIPLRRARPWT